MLTNTATRYGAVARGLHWAMALLVIAALALGLNRQGHAAQCRHGRLAAGAVFAAQDHQGHGSGPGRAAHPLGAEPATPGAAASPNGGWRPWPPRRRIGCFMARSWCFPLSGLGDACGRGRLRPDLVALSARPCPSCRDPTQSPGSPGACISWPPSPWSPPWPPYRRGAETRADRPRRDAGADVARGRGRGPRGCGRASADRLGGTGDLGRVIALPFAPAGRQQAGPPGVAPGTGRGGRLAGPNGHARLLRSSRWARRVEGRCSNSCGGAAIDYDPQTGTGEVAGEIRRDQRPALGSGVHRSGQGAGVL